jgi:hypothetical protein
MERIEPRARPDPLDDGTGPAPPLGEANQATPKSLCRDPVEHPPWPFPLRVRPVINIAEGIRLRRLVVVHLLLQVLLLQLPVLWWVRHNCRPRTTSSPTSNRTMRIMITTRRTSAKVQQIGRFHPTTIYHRHHHLRRRRRHRHHHPLPHIIASVDEAKVRMRW